MLLIERQKTRCTVFAFNPDNLGQISPRIHIKPLLHYLYFVTEFWPNFLKINSNAAVFVLSVKMTLHFRISYAAPPLKFFFKMTQKRSERTDPVLWIGRECVCEPQSFVYVCESGKNNRPKNKCTTPWKRFVSSNFYHQVSNMSL